MIVRNITEDDKHLLTSLIEKDEHHKDTTTADFFFEEGTRCVVYENEERDSQMFVRMSNCLRLDIQFDNDKHVFNAKTILKRLPGLIAWARSRGFKEVVFNSNSMELIAFLNNKFGFEPISNDFRIFI